MEKKIGAYLCSGCGIGEALDVKALEGVVSKEFKKPVKSHECLCGEAGLAVIKADMEAGDVTLPVIGACSPRVMTDRFMLPGMTPIRANLREQVIWSHPAGDEDTQMMAEDNMRMMMTMATKVNQPVPFTEGEFSTTILVVGGGYAGLTAASEASKAGHDVLLVEKKAALGGNAAGYASIVPSKPPYHDPQPNPLPKLIEGVNATKSIRVITGATVAKTSGMPGKFEVELSDGSTHTVGAIILATGFRPYDATKLSHLGYGASPDIVTNVEMEAKLKAGKVTTKAGSSPKAVAFIQCAGSRDPNHLPYCSSVCCSVSLKQAIELTKADPETMVYVIYEEMRTPGTTEEFYRSAQEAGVIFMKGKATKVENGSGITVTVADELLQQDVPLGPLDMVVLATGMVPNSTDPDAPAQEYGAELLTADINPYPAEGDYKPEPSVPPGGPLLNLQYRQGPHLPMLADGFSDSHYICFPYETRRTGIYACGPVRRPMDMGEVHEDAMGAVLKSIQVIRNAAQGHAVHPRVGDLSYPKINLNACTKCRRCTVECPFGAIDENEKDYPVVNPTRCRRCGTCMGACPVRTISFDNYTVEMLSSMVKAVNIPDEDEEKPRILVIACENDAYPALDMAGIAKHQYSPFIRILPVRCLGSMSLLLISDALSSGYDGVILMGCKPGDDYQCHFVKGSAMAKERLSKISETLKSMQLEVERVTMVDASIADGARLPKVIDELVAKIDAVGPNPFKGF
ncbi:MAG: hydrogenase iron-sulfur subunit [Rhodospirillales bacterium]|nr:hydrogenase iron-sulfur subunit [Rhodospirillales bacterium]